MAVLPDLTDRRERRRVLGELLRSRRGRLAPETVGLPASPRSRTPGLRREDVAVLASVSVTYYTWLEQGRGTSPSPPVVDALAGALRLDEAETSYVKALLAEPVAAAECHAGSWAVVADLVEAAEPMATPVYGVDDDGVVIALNSAAAEWYGSLGDGDKPNVLTWFFTDDARRRVVDWEAAVRELVTRIRFHAAVRDLSPEAWRRLSDLYDTDEHFAASWDTYDVAQRVETTRSLRAADGTVRTWRVVPTRPVLLQGATILHHLPASGRSYAAVAAAAAAANVAATRSAAAPMRRGSS